MGLSYTGRMFTPREEATLRDGGIGPQMADFLDSVAKNWPITRSLEIGVAGGVGSEIICRYSPDHHGVDTSVNFYLDSSLPTAGLVLGKENFTLHIGNVSQVSHELPESNFVYIDAEHRHPHPAMDLYELIAADKLIYPCLLVLDDIGLSLKYMEGGPRYLGPFILYSGLRKRFETTLSDPMELGPVAFPNQVAIKVTEPHSLLEGVLEALALPPE